MFWFHPLVWWANARIRQEREKCCDEMVIAHLGTQPRSYSRALVEALLVEQKAHELLPSLAIAGPARNVEERIKTMLRPGKRFYRRPSLLAAAGAVLLALLLVPTTLALTRRQAEAVDTPPRAVAPETAGKSTEAKRLASAVNLKRLGLALTMHAMDHEGKYPDDLMSLVDRYIAKEDAEQLASFISSDAEYLGAGKTQPKERMWDIPLAYDLTLLRSGAGTNVVFADGHVAFVGSAQLDKYGIKLPESHLEILEVRFEPIHQGKNVVHVTIQNTSDAEQVFATHIYTRSPDYGEGGVGWGTPFSDTIKPQEKKPARFVFKIQGPVTDRTYVNLGFYNPETPDKYEYKRYFERRQYKSAELPKAQPGQVKGEPASPAEAQAVTQALSQVQGYIREKQYEQAWGRFSKDFREAEYQRTGFESFHRAMEPEHPLHSAFTWEREDFLQFKPGQVLKSDGVLTLAAALDGQTWSIDFVQDAGQWKLDWIAGYVPKILGILKEQEQSPPSQAAGKATTGNLKVLDIRFEQIQSGRCAVRLQVQNTSQTDQVFGLDIRTESSVQNWQRQFTQPLKAGQTEALRFEFEITGPLQNASLIRLQFYNPPSLAPAALDLDNWFEQHTYTGAKFDREEVAYGRQPGAPQTRLAPKAEGNLKILDVQFEPLHAGKNAVRIQVENSLPQERVFAVSIQARNSGQGGRFGGWGTTLFETLKPGQAQWARFGFKIWGPPADSTSIELWFFDPGPAQDFDREKWLARKPWDEWFKEMTYSGRDLERFKPETGTGEPASPRDTQAAGAMLRQLQKHLANKEYEAAWPLLSKEFRDAELFDRFEYLQDRMEKPYTLAFPIGRADLLAVEPASATRHNGVLALTAATKTQAWTFSLVNVEGRWLIDSIERAKPPAGAASLKEQQEAVTQAFAQFQSCLRDQKYEAAWEMVTGEIRGQYQDDPQKWVQAMQSDGAIRTVFANLRPESVTEGDGFLALNARYENLAWKLLFVQEQGQWRLYLGQAQRGDWQETLLPTLPKRVTDHFDIYYFKNSTAEREIEQIARQKEEGFKQICRFLGKDSDIRIRMVFFEDGQTKQIQTGHQGAGWAFGNTIVEIYNDKEKLDPYHETTHILMGPVGSPPALFNEGFATYMSEKLGTHALANLDGGQATIHQRAAELKAKGEWIELPTLLSFREIGSPVTRPPIAYAEAGSFVKFLLDTYGKDKFLEAYGSLQNSNQQSVQQENVRKLGEIFGHSLPELEAQWHKLLATSS